MIRPSIDIRVSGKSFSRHVSDVQLTAALLPAVGSARINFPRGVDLSVSVDDEAEVFLDNGEENINVLTGSVRVVRRSLEGSYVIVADHSARLSARRAAQTFEGQTAGKIIAALADMVGLVPATNDAGLELPVYVADQRHTLAEHISHLARLSSCLALIRADGKLDIRAWPAGSADLALKHGRELLTYQTDSVAVPPAQRFAIGNGSAGSAAAPDVLRPSFTYLPADAAAPGKDVIWLATPEIRTASDAKSAGEGLTLQYAANAGRVHATTWLQPNLRPGMVVEIQELPNGMSGGPWLLTTARHSLTAAGAFTSIDGVNADAAGALDGLLSLAGSALGGLL